jgi:hypothetical protein
MLEDKIIQAATEEFKQNLRHSLENLSMATLTPELATQVSQGLQESICSAALVGYRTFLESYDEKQDILQVDEQVLRFKIASEKIFLTPFGEMTVTRNLYQADAGGAAYVPLDAKWGMTGEYAMPQVQECVLLAAAHLTPKEVASLLKKSSLFHPSATAINNMIQESGELIEAHLDELQHAIRDGEEVPQQTQVVVASMDGVNVLMREPGKKSGRPKERPDKPETNPEPASTYKNAMVGSISFYGIGEDENGEMKPERIQSRYLARMPEERCPTFKAQFEAELDHVEKAVNPNVKKVLLNDGHRTIWSYLDQNARYNEYEKLVDFYHTTEHLSKAAEALFGKKSAAADDWYNKWYGKLLEEDDAATGVVRSLEYHARQQQLRQSRANDLRQERTFFRQNQHRMTYADFRRRGLPIGSGPVEAACKSIVKNRMCRSGMRWSDEGGQKILNLRVFVKADRWDSFWENYMNLKRAA